MVAYICKRAWKLEDDGSFAILWQDKNLLKTRSAAAITHDIGLDLPE